MGTNFQEVFDSFFIKIPSVDFTNKESQVIQFFKSAIGKCYRIPYDDIQGYIYDENLKEGYFKDIISQSSIELISMYMVKEFLSQKLAILCGRKQYLGTQSFNKIPNMKEELDVTLSSLNYWTNEIDNLVKEFPDYSDER